MFPTSTTKLHHKAKVSLFCKLTWPEFFHLYFRVIVKCTADLGLGKGGTSGKYFQSNYLEFRGIGLGEKALGISANGAASRHKITNSHHSISSAVALGILMIFSTAVNWRHLLFVKCTSTFRTECDHCCSFKHVRIKYWRGVKREVMFCLPCRVC